MSAVNSTPQLKMYYPSVPTAYYATGQWRFETTFVTSDAMGSRADSNKDSLRRNAYYTLTQCPIAAPTATSVDALAKKIQQSKEKDSKSIQSDTDKMLVKIVKDGIVSRLYFNGQENGVDSTHDINSDLDERIFFQTSKFFRPDPNKKPSTIKNSYWQQAPIPQNLDVAKRFPQITRNSGKFLVFVDPAKLDAIWEKFKAVYNEGKLGYGLMCGTGKENRLQLGKETVVVVFTEDAFDLSEVARVAWEIDKLLGDWKGALQYQTDRTTKAKSNDGCRGPKLPILFKNGRLHPELDMLYTIRDDLFVAKGKEESANKLSLEDFAKSLKLNVAGKRKCVKTI